MPSEDDSDPSVASVLRDLDALRSRLDHAPTWLRDGETTVSAAGLAEEVRRLCEQAASDRNPSTAASSLAKARKCLQHLHRLLGVH